MKQIVLCVSFFAFLLVVPEHAQAAVQSFVSAPVSGSGQSAREQVDAMDDAWRTAIADAALCDGTLTTGSLSEDAFPIVFDDGVNLQVTMTLLDMDGGDSFDGTAATSQGGIGSATSTTMQDGAPKPQSLFVADEAYYNETAGSKDSRNGLLFTFSQPITAFGAFFGDVESRTDGMGTPAILQLFDAAGEQIGNDQVIAPHPEDPGFDQAQCGDPTDGTFRGCGNRTTQWIGFTADAVTPVSAMLVIVGDDDTSDGSDDGNTEHLSFIGPTACTQPVYDLSITKEDDVDPVAIGDIVTYTITVSNDGVDTVQSITIDDTYDPTAMTLIDAAPSQGACEQGSAGVLTCALGDIAVGEVATITTVFSVQSEATLTNTASVMATGQTFSPDDDTVTEETQVIAPIAPPSDEPQEPEVIDAPEDRDPEDNDADDSLVDDATENVAEVQPLAPTVSQKECHGSIGNTIWRDINHDGIQNRTEKGIENIRVKLLGPDDAVYRTDTNHTGHYLFEDLPVGIYKVVVKEDDVKDFRLTYDPTGTKNHRTTVELSCNDHHTKADFGYAQEVAVSSTQTSPQQLAQTGKDLIGDIIITLLFVCTVVGVVYRLTA